MRTTYVIVAGFFSPAVVAVVGLGDLFSMIMTHIGLRIGGRAIALSSQNIGSQSLKNRNEAITQAILLGFLVGISFTAFGLTFSYATMELLGAEADVIRMGGQYLVVITIAAPTMHVTFIAARATQGTGNTLTPMLIRGLANGINIVGTIALAFGIGPLPQLSIAGLVSRQLSVRRSLRRRSFCSFSVRETS